MMEKKRYKKAICEHMRLVKLDDFPQVTATVNKEVCIFRPDFHLSLFDEQSLPLEKKPCSLKQVRNLNPRFAPTAYHF